VLAVGYFFSGRLLQPVRSITQDVADISAQNLVRRLATGSTKDEWYHLASTLNDLLNRLQESFDMQRGFIANASHELSTPLTSISSQLEVALQRERSAEDYRRVMQSTYQDVKHMSRLTHTLLEFRQSFGK
jgi:signal transduction histidine kinase